MLIQKKITVYVTRQSITVPETLYSEGFDVELDGNKVEFFLDFSASLSEGQQTSQRNDPQNLESDLESSRNPTVLEVNLEKRESFDAAHEAIREYTDLEKQEQPLKFFLNLKLSDTYRLGCEVKISEEYKQIRFNITE